MNVLAPNFDAPVAARWWDVLLELLQERDADGELPEEAILLDARRLQVVVAATGPGALPGQRELGRRWGVSRRRVAEVLWGHAAWGDPGLAEPWETVLEDRAGIGRRLHKAASRAVEERANADNTQNPCHAASAVCGIPVDLLVELVRSRSRQVRGFKALLERGLEREDVYQEVLMACLRKAESPKSAFDPARVSPGRDGSREGAWVYVVARSQIANMLAKLPQPGTMADDEAFTALADREAMPWHRPRGSGPLSKRAKRRRAKP